MKIVIVSPPKSGASRLRCLMAVHYGLRAIDARDAPKGDSPESVIRWLETLPEECVTQSNLPFISVALSSAATFGVTFIAILRHPFDLFISNHVVRSHRDQRANRRSHLRVVADAGFPERQPADLGYPWNEFSDDLQSMLNWSSGATLTVRYEEFLERPQTTLAEIATVFGNLDKMKIARTVELCPAEQQIVSSGNRGVRMIEIPPGSWRTRIDRATLDQLQNRFGQAVARLGYDPSPTTSS